MFVYLHSYDIVSCIFSGVFCSFSTVVSTGRSRLYYTIYIDHILTVGFQIAGKIWQAVLLMKIYFILYISVLRKLDTVLLFTLRKITRKQNSLICSRKYQLDYKCYMTKYRNRDRSKPLIRHCTYTSKIVHYFSNKCIL